MELIKAWLNGAREYNTGVKLYLQFGGDSLLKKMFSTEKQTPFKKQQLEAELQSLYNEHSAGTRADQPAPPLIDTQNIMKTWPAESCPDDVAMAIRNQWLLKFKEMQDIRSQLLLLPNDDQRCEAAFKVLRLDRECDELLYQRDQYKLTGKLPEQKQNDYVQDTLQMGVRMETLKRYIRREADALRIDKANVAAAARRKEFITELNYYLSKLNKPLYVDRLQSAEQSAAGE